MLTAVLKEIKKLNLSKGIQDLDMPVMVFKKILISLLITFISNETADSSNFSDIFKSADIATVFRQSLRNQK